MRLLFKWFTYCWSFAACAQLSSSQLSIENNQFVLAPQELEVLLAHKLVDSLQMQQLNNFFQAGGTIVDFYQLQGLLTQSEHVQLIALLPYLLLAPSRLGTALTTFDLKTFQVKIELRTLFAPIQQLPNQQLQNPIWEIAKDSSFLGTSEALDLRCQLSVSNWRLGGHLSKDAGEPLWHKGYAKGFDFLSAYAFWKSTNNKQVLHKMILGSYQIQWGQGLQLWSSRGMGKSIDLLQMVRTANGLQPYQSNDEQRFLQGAALHLQKRNQQMLIFGSVKYTDAKKLIDSTQLDFNFSYTTGYHRTAAEIAKRNLLLEQIYGLALLQRMGVLQAGILGLYQQSSPRAFVLDSFFAGLEIQPFSIFNMGLFAQTSWRQFYFYSEAVLCAPQHLLFVQKSALNLAFIYLLDPKIELGFHYRYYGPQYQTFYANPIGNSSLGMNERGLIFQLKCQLQRYTVVKLASEFAAQPFLLSGSKWPSKRFEMRLQFQHQTARKHELSGQLVQRFSTSTSAQWNALFNFTLKPLKGQEIDLNAQLNGGSYAFGLSYIFACGWRYAPMNKSIRWEIKQGVFQNVQAGTSLLTHFYLLGVGSQTVALNGVGALTMASLRWTFAAKCQMQAHVIYRKVYAPLAQQKLQFGILLRYQF